jgi:predicted Zn-dependent protease
VLAVITNGDPGLIHQLGNQVISSSFSRDSEEEADAFALKTLENAQLKPSSLAEFFFKLNEADMTYDESLEILMSHPHNNKRILHAVEYKCEDDFVYKPLDVDWSIVTAQF